MTAISDFCGTIRSWLNRDDYDDALITSWVRMAEELLSEQVRCKHMVQIDTATIAASRVLLPSDWLEMDLVREIDGRVLRYRARDEFYNNRNDDPNYNSGFYTLSGNYIIFADVGDGTDIEITYYQTIPPLGATANWLMTYYSRLYLAATLSAASAFGLEDDRAVMWQTSMQAFVDTINDNHRKDKVSGSVLVPRRNKGFG